MNTILPHYKCFIQVLLLQSHVVVYFGYERQARVIKWIFICEAQDARWRQWQQKVFAECAAAERSRTGVARRWLSVFLNVCSQFLWCAFVRENAMAGKLTQSQHFHTLEYAQLLTTSYIYTYIIVQRTFSICKYMCLFVVDAKVRPKIVRFNLISLLL